MVRAVLVLVTLSAGGSPLWASEKCDFSPLVYSQFERHIADLKGEDNVYRALRNEPLTFERTVAGLVSLLPPRTSSWVRKAFREIQKQGIEVESVRGLSFNDAKLNFENRWIRPWRVHPSSQATLRWPSPRRPRTNKEVQEALNLATHFLSVAATTPPRHLTVYARGPGSFTSGNLKAMAERVRLQAAADPSRDSLTKAIAIELYSALRSLVLTQSPFHYANLSRIKVNEVHRRVLERWGSEGLYHYMVATQGPAVGFKYAAVHLTNASIAAGLALLAYLAPVLMEADDAFSEGDTLEFETEEEAEEARGILERTRQDPNAMLKELRGINSENPDSKERKEINDFLDRLDEQLKAPSEDGAPNPPSP